jgi:hypothetical protein
MLGPGRVHLAGMRQRRQQRTVIAVTLRATAQGEVGSHACPMSQNVYTTVASSMLMHTEILTSRLANVPIGLSRRVLKIPPPAGPSSNGGAQARQSLMLSSEGEQPVCGWVDFAAAVAEVRDYESTRTAYEARYRKGFDVNEAEYRVWLQKLLAVLKELGVRCGVTGDPVAYAPTDPATSESGSEEGEKADDPYLVHKVVGVLLVAALGIAAVAFIVFR